MLYRQEKQGKIAITQPMIAWLSGQLARAWGNERFGDVVPYYRPYATEDDDPNTLFLTPWPFHRQPVTFVYEGRYLAETFSNEAMMREALKHAPWVTLKTVLFPNETE